MQKNRDRKRVREKKTQRDTTTRVQQQFFLFFSFLLSPIVQSVNAETKRLLKVPKYTKEQNQNCFETAETELDHDEKLGWPDI